MSQGISLVEALRLFNRKERNLLICRALDHSVNDPPSLGGAFRRDVAAALRIGEIPLRAWWAIDYHMNWIAGALAYLAEGEAALNVKSRENTSLLSQSSLKSRYLLEGNQEDIDLIIAFDNTLILVEAKAYSSPNKKQTCSKAKRLQILNNYYNKSIKNQVNINFFFLYLAPEKENFTEAEWPRWARDPAGPADHPSAAPARVIMELPDKVLATERHSAHDIRWRIKNIST